MIRTGAGPYLRRCVSRFSGVRIWMGERMNRIPESESNSAVARSLECAAVGILSASFLGLLTMRLGVFNAPLVWLGAACIVFVYFRIAGQRPTSSFPTPALWQIILVVAVGLLFRVPPYLDMLGGTDSAAYVNMGMHLARTGGLIPVDHILERLADPASQQFYVSTSQLRELTYLPGIYGTPEGLVFQFYPLFPVWLALFGSIGGPQVAVYALTFLSLVSLVYFQCLGCLLTGRRSLGLLAGLLLAVNPLHAYVSKLTVAEITLLAHVLMSFFFLLVYCSGSEKENGAPKRLIWISAFALGLGFMTRINGFLYLPFLVLVFLGALIFDDNPARRKGIILWVGASTAFYFFSVWYGLTWSSPYANDIYRNSFERFGPRWPLVLEIFGFVTLLVLAGCSMLVPWARRTGRIEWLREHIPAAMRLLPYVMLLMAAVSLYRAYQAGFTDAYAGDAWIRSVSSVHGWKSFCATSMPLVALYLSPFIVIAFAIAVFRRELSIAQRALLAFVAFFFCVYSILLWYIGNYPAVHRYLLSELVPGMLLFAVCALGAANISPTHRKFVTVLMVLGGLWCAGLSSAQWGKKENEGAKATFDEIARNVDSHDVLLVSTTKVQPSELQVPLNYIYGLNTARMGDGDLRNTTYLAALQAGFAKVYLLSDKKNAPDGFERVEDIPFVVHSFRGGDYPPTTGVKRYDMPLALYRMTAPR